MPPARINLKHTNDFRANMVEEWFAARERGVGLRAFCRLQDGVGPSKLILWVQKYDDYRTTDAPTALTLGGSGRRSDTHLWEGQLVVWVKDLRRVGKPVSRLLIITAAKRMMPWLFEGRSDNACLLWCGRFMIRSNLTLRRITTAGRLSRANLLAEKISFSTTVKDYLKAAFGGAGSSVRKRVLNMDQTAIFGDAKVITTVEEVGAETVPCITEGPTSCRVTVALLVRADGVMFPPHFVFKGAPAGAVEREVRMFAPPDVATFSVQENAWFDDRVMQEWIDYAYFPTVESHSLLILDSLKIHKSTKVSEKLAEVATDVLYVPSGCTGVSQPLDVGVMAPFKARMRREYIEHYSFLPAPQTAPQMRRSMFIRAMSALRSITNETIMNSFDAAGPFFDGDNEEATILGDANVEAVAATLESESGSWVDEIVI